MQNSHFANESTTMKKSLHGFALLLLLSLLAACGVAKFTYGIADNLALRELDDYFDLNSSQKDATRADLEAMLAWHRSQELPVYAEIMRELSADIRQPATPARVNYYYEQMLAARTRALDYLEEPAINFVARLGLENAEHFQERLAEEEEEWLEEQEDLSPEEAFEEYYEELLDNAEDWFDDFSDLQQEQLEALARIWWQERLEREAQGELEGEAWRERWLALLGSGASRELIADELRQWRAYWLEPQVPERITAQQQRRQRQIQRLLDFLAIPDQEQRDHASAKLQDYLESVEDIIAD